MILSQYKVNILSSTFLDERTLVLATTKPGGYDYQAGQYTKLTIQHSNPDSRGDTRDFSFASNPKENQLLFISRIPDIHSTYKEAMRKLQIGDVIFVDIPKGQFLLPPDASLPMVWIAAGVGIAPFRSFVLSSQSFSNTKMFYTNPTSNYAFIDDFRSIDVTLNNSKIDGHFTKDTFSRLDKTALYYLCGNTKFILSVQQVLLTLGIKPSQFRKDVFTGY